MTYLTWLPDCLRNAGLAVREIDGWRKRGHRGFDGVPRGVLCHHTAGPRAGLFPSERVVVQGRPGLPGPLANLGLARDGTWIIVAAGLAYHAGAGFHPDIGREGNLHLIGIEAESTGVRRPDGSWDWTPEQLRSYPRGVAALLKHLRLPASRAIAHREWAPRRKIDPAGIDMPQFRAEVARWMEHPGDAAPPASTSPPGDGQRTFRLTTPYMRGDDIRRFQAAANRRYTKPPYWRLEDDGIYGADSARWVRLFQSRAGLEVDGVFGPASRAAFGGPF